MTEIHAPVLLAEVLNAIEPRDGGRYVDGTFGAGGYTTGLLDAAECRVWAIDRDPDAIDRGKPLKARYGDRLTLVHGRFGEMDRLMAEQGEHDFDGIALDLGVSSPQLDEAERGFSFREDGPLDMRMSKSGPSAADVVNTASETDLADIIFHLGEERYARRVARAIVAARTDGAILRTRTLADLVRGVVPTAKSGAKSGAKSRKTIHPATRTFQALRIHVNGELDELDHGLRAAELMLSPNGRLAVVSFHSLEDRRVKTFIRNRSGGAARPSRHLAFADATDAPPPSLRAITRRPISPGEPETRRNPRARSARLRVAERTEAPAWPEEVAA
ncbi:MAG: 16S rRNA (cytosine(1402)-N(4))-methyltransferase RsmH [Rhodospirillaceae bacterium]|nr:16S rRNA (cytosine(1402)-N(4))-methyltransferase RsmH [Rhodospirillaceae bacterium]MBT6140135.1 16S rRNA (cytosine(1402)-N(4))-methyltransferase RsmH [Rhodospirillaceae bacterium]